MIVSQLNKMTDYEKAVRQKLEKKGFSGDELEKEVAKIMVNAPKIERKLLPADEIKELKLEVVKLKTEIFDLKQENKEFREELSIKNNYEMEEEKADVETPVETPTDEAKVE